MLNQILQTPNTYLLKEVCTSVRVNVQKLIDNAPGLKSDTIVLVYSCVFETPISAILMKWLLKFI